MVFVCVELKMMLNSADREEASRPRSAVGLASCFTRDVIGLDLNQEGETLTDSSECRP